MTEARRSTAAAGGVRAGIPLAALLVLFAAVLGYGLWLTAQKADAVEAERSATAIRSSVAGLVARLEGTAVDNGYWDELAVAVYRPTMDAQFVESRFATPTLSGGNYDAAYFVDAQGRTVLAFSKGQRSDQDALKRFGPALASLSAKAQTAGKAVAGLIRVGNDISLIAVTHVAPTTPALARRLANRQALKLVLVKRITTAVVQDLGRSLDIQGLTIGSENSAGLSFVLYDAAGRALAFASWEPSLPGELALRRATPMVMLSLMLAIALALFVTRQLYKAFDKLAFQARFDGLSRLPNRQALRAEIEARVRRGDDIVLGLLDLDGFKGINDNYGHNVGDRLIVKVGHELDALCARHDFVARLGGDEFAYLISGRGCVEHANRFASQLLRRLSAPFRVDERTLVIGASIGLTHSTSKDIQPEEVVRQADVAMYVAKRAGKMRSQWFDEGIDRAQAAQHAMELQLRTALADGSLRVEYQPLVAANGADVIGVEALVRWLNADGKDISPATFIPVAEESGLIDAIGLFVLRRACMDGLRWPDIQVAVNVSAAQLRNPGLPRHIAAILKDTKFPAARLEIEITETYLIRDPETAVSVLVALQKLGVSISLDDFGTGYASIGFLRQFSFDRLKLDRSIVVDAESSPSARALLQASVTVARALDMEIAAEGVETAAQAELMRVVGCDQLQGWLFSPACSADELTRMLDTHRQSATA